MFLAMIMNLRHRNRDGDHWTEYMFQMVTE
jgi:hypothetical protein